MASWNMAISTPLPTSNKCAQLKPNIKAKVVVVTQHASVIFQTRESWPPACKLDTPTTIELKIRGIKSIFNRPIKILLTTPIPYKLMSKKAVPGKRLRINPKMTPKIAAIRICVFKLIASCFSKISLGNYAM